MRAGQLRHRITIEEQVTSQEQTYGSIETNIAPRSPCWASVEPLSGKERLGADRAEASVTHRVRIRYQPDVKPDMRVNFQGRYLNIISVINKEERNIELELLCSENL